MQFKGEVKFYNKLKKFGFIRCKNTGTEYFVHEQGCIDSIEDKQMVSFDVTEDKRGPKAINVRLLT